MTEQNMEQMDINVIKEKAEQGDVEAQYELGYRYQKRVFKKTAKKAVNGCI